MGYTLTVYKIYPDDPEKINEIQENINKQINDPYKINQITTEPIAFGLNLIKVAIIFPDKEGLSDQLETKLKRIPNVSEIELEVCTLV